MVKFSLKLADSNSIKAKDNSSFGMEWSGLISLWVKTRTVPQDKLYMAKKQRNIAF